MDIMPQTVPRWREPTGSERAANGPNPKRILRALSTPQSGPEAPVDVRPVGELEERLARRVGMVLDQTADLLQDVAALSNIREVILRGVPLVRHSVLNRLSE